MPAATVVVCLCSNAPFAIHLDHVTSIDSAVTAICLGCNSVMVEGDFSYVHGLAGEDAEQHLGEVIYTTHAEARSFVARSSVVCRRCPWVRGHGRMRGRPSWISDASQRSPRRWNSSGHPRRYGTLRSDAAARSIRENASRVRRRVVHDLTRGAPAAEAMMKEGRCSLAAITGVRRRALMESARYRYCWLISFCSEPVIDAYMNHPDHLALSANNAACSDVASAP